MSDLFEMLAGATIPDTAKVNLSNEIAEQIDIIDGELEFTIEELDHEVCVRVNVYTNREENFNYYSGRQCTGHIWLNVNIDQVLDSQGEITESHPFTFDEGEIEKILNR